MRFTHRQRVAGSIASVACAAMFALPGHAQPPKSEKQAPEPQPLKDVVRLIEADAANETWTTGVVSGAARPFELRVMDAEPEANRQAELTVTVFDAQQPGAGSVPAKIRLADGGAWANAVGLVLNGPATIRMELLLDALRPATTYKGRLAIAAGRLLFHRWEVTLTTAPGQGTFTVQAIPPMKLVTIPSCRWLIVRWALQDCDASSRTFSFALANASDAPFTRVRVRFEPSTGATANKSLVSNFSIDSFSFSRNAHQIDLQSGPGAGNAVELPSREQLTISAHVAPLTPGEYTGTLRFGAAEISDKSQEPALPVLVQVRHHWIFPVSVILIGSFVGWFGSKYVVGARKRRMLMRQVRDLQARADDFARSEPRDITWHSPGEATSYALLRVRVILSQLSDLSASVLPMLLREEEINQTRRDAEQRIAALESVRTVRVSVEPRAVARPAAQLVVGRLLREIHGILEGVTFGDAQQAELAKLIEQTKAWASDDTFGQRYREAILERRRGRDVPTQKQIDAVRCEAIRDRLRELEQQLPTEQQISAAQNLAELEKFDAVIAEMNLVWREQDKPWNKDLVPKAKAKTPTPVSELFDLVDLKTWEYLSAHNASLSIERDRIGYLHPQAYDTVIINLTSDDKYVDDKRLKYHPLQVAWTISFTSTATERPRVIRMIERVFGGARAPRVDEVVNPERCLTPGLRLMHYFPTAGQADIKAELYWKARAVPVKDSVHIDVLPDTRYRLRAVLSDWTEYAIILLGAGFAAATGMSTVYDATFGGFGQYLTLLSWAAGAATGGNIFKELGTAMTVGGRADVSLPAGQH